MFVGYRKCNFELIWDWVLQPDLRKWNNQYILKLQQKLNNSQLDACAPS